MTKVTRKKNSVSLHRVPPHNLEAEQQILGAVLSDNSSLQVVRSMLSPENFYQDGHRLLYQAMCEIAERGQAFDTLLLADLLGQQGKLAKIGGASYLSQLLDSTVSSANVAHYCRLVKDKASLRNLLDVAEGIRERVFSTNGADAANILEDAKDSLTSVHVAKDAGLQFVDAGTWMEEEPAAADQVLEGVFDVGDKVAIIGSSKLLKSFFLLQMVICASTGLGFLNWKAPKPRMVCLIQFEMRSHHFHRRLKRLCRGLEVDSKYLKDRLHILNARGLQITGREGIERIRKAIIDLKPELVCFDPLYKVADGIENAAEGLKPILNAFDALAEQTGAAILYVHHDAKGSPGDRDIRDRGAGSNVLGRDFDAGITLTAHATDENSIVVETLLRNYRPQDPFTIQFIDDEHGGYRFEERPDIVAEKRTSRTKPQQPAFSTYFPIAEIILGNSETEISTFREDFKKQTGLSDHRIRGFLAWATSGGNPHLIVREHRGIGIHKKWIRLARKLNDEE